MKLKRWQVWRISPIRTVLDTSFRWRWQARVYAWYEEGAGYFKYEVREGYKGTDRRELPAVRSGRITLKGRLAVFLGFWVVVAVLLALAACEPGSCDRKDGCFGDGKFSSEKEEG
jgi:hypothetical protein